MKTDRQSASRVSVRRLVASAISSAMIVTFVALAPPAFGAPNDRGDADGDGMSNYAEFNFGTNPDDPDTDHDSLLDPAEVHKHKTDPNKPDTDDDGVSDRYELDTGTDPLVNNNAPRQQAPPPPQCPNGGPGDCDGDGMLDADESNGWNTCECVTDPNNSDTDSDGVNDGEEDEKGTNPLDVNNK